MIISVVPMFRGPDDTDGHFASVQLGFVESAKQIQERFVIFDGKFFWESSSENGLEKIAQALVSDNVFEGVADWLEEFPPIETVTLMVFEGSLGTIKKVSDFAWKWPDIRIYINLFYPEPGLSIPGTYEHFVGEITDGKMPSLVNEVKKILDELPSIRLACDSEARSYLAQSLGLRIDATWHGRSPVGLISRRYLENIEGNDIVVKDTKIFVTVDINRFTSSQFLWCIQVIRFVSAINRNQENQIEWTFNFLPTEVELRFRILKRLLPRKNVKFVQSKVDLESYAKRIHNANLIWLPLSPYYASSSSGRVADAITLRKPVLVPSGTYGHFEISRWIKNWPTYRNQFECAQIMLNMPNLQHLADARLRDQHEEISEFYSNENQLLEVIGSEFKIRKITDKTKRVTATTKNQYFKEQVTIVTFARSLAYSLSPNLHLRLLKLGLIVIKQKTLRVFNGLS